MEQLQRKGFDVDSLKYHDQHTDSTQGEARAERANETVHPSHDSWDYRHLSMDQIQSLLQQPATPQALSDFLWHFGEGANQDVIQSQTQPFSWEGSSSLPDPVFRGSIEPMMELNPDGYIDPTMVSFGLTDSLADPRDQSNI